MTINGERGRSITLDVFFYDKTPSLGGVLTDPDSTPSINLYDPDGIQIISNDNNTERIETGHYKYTWDIPLSAKLGNYRLEWTAYINGVEVRDINDGSKLDEVFGVIDAIISTAPTGMYCSVEEVIKLTGIFENVLFKEIGTGNGSTYIFELGDMNIGEFTEKIYINDELKIRETDYNIDYDRGIISFITTPTTSAIIKASYKKITNNFTNEDIKQIIGFTSDEIYFISGDIFGELKETIEYYDGISKPQTPRDGTIYQTADPYVYDPDYIMLENFPVQEIIAVREIDKDGNITREFDTDEYVFYSTGKLLFRNYKIQDGNKNIEVVYKYGHLEVPRYISKLCSIMSGIQIFISLSGGSYQNINSYSLGKLSVTKGNKFDNLQKQVEALEKQKEQIINKIQRMDLFVV